jgi:hypothetical protein
MEVSEDKKILIKNVSLNSTSKYSSFLSGKPCSEVESLNFDENVAENPLWLGLRSEVGNEFTSVPSPLPDLSGPTHNAGSTSAARNLAVAPLRISRGRQYRRLLLTDNSKPVSAGRGLPTLTSLALPGAASDDERDQEASNYGRARDDHRLFTGLKRYRTFNPW